MGSLFNVDELRVFRGRDLQIAPGFRVRQPTLGEIEGGEADDGEGCERVFFSTVYTLLATPTDLMAHLDKIGIRYEDVTNYQLFMMLFPQIDPKGAALLFGKEMTPGDFRPTPVDNQPGRVVLGNWKTGTVIDEVCYAAMVQYICSFMHAKQTQFMKNGNAFTRMVRMDLAYEEWEMSKKRPYTSTLKTLISTMTNMEGFKYGWKDVWDMKIGAFMDAVMRVQAVVTSKAMLSGCYSGMIDVSKFTRKNKEQLNYMRKLP